MIDDKQLIAQLLASDLIDPTCLKEGLELAEQEQSTLYNVLLSHRLLDEQDVVATASEILNVPSIHLQEADLDEDIAHLIPFDLAMSSQTLPLEVIEDGGMEVLKLAMTDPIDVMAMDEIASHIGIDIRPVLAGPADLKNAIDKLYGDVDDDEEEEILDLDDVILEDDDIIELDDMELEDSIDFNDFGADDDPGAMPELIDAPMGIIDDEDSWAAMFDAAEHPPESDVDEQDEPNKNAESFFSGALADDDEDENSDIRSAETVERKQEVMAGNQTQLGGPVTMENLGLDEDDDGFEEFESSHTHVGNPAKMGLDEAFGKSGHALFSAEEGGEESETDDEKGEEAKEVKNLELGDEFYADDDEDSQEEQIQPLRDSSTSRYTPAGIGARGAQKELEEETVAKLSIDPEAPPPSTEEPVDEDEADEKDEKDTQGEKNEKSKKKSAVPNSIRAALQKASKRNKDKSKAQKEPSTSDDSAAALGRIKVKKVAVPAFKGAIEKRSDRERKKKKEQRKTPTSTQVPTSTKTREIPLTEMADLSRELNEKYDAQSPVKLPKDLDTDLVLRGLIQLLLAKELIDEEDLHALIDELT